MNNMDNKLWQELLYTFENSEKKIVFDIGTIEEGKNTLNMLRISQNSVLGSIVLNTSGIEIDSWIRILGHKGLSNKGILSYNLIDEEGIAKKIDKMLIVGHDVVGGIFALNAGYFLEGIGDIWYFAPDTLTWETLGMKYSEYIAWAVRGNVDEFYTSMRWSTWREEAEKAKFDEAILIYPFLWSKELQIEKAEKKIVSVEELFNINLEYSKRFGLS